MKELSVNATSPQAALDAVVDELGKRRIPWVSITADFSDDQRDDDHVAVVVTKPRGIRATYDVLVDVRKDPS